MRVLNASIESKMFPPFPIPNGMHEVFHSGIFFKIAKEFEQKEAHGIVGEAGQGVLIGYDQADKRKVNQGSDESGETPGNSAIGMDFDISSFVSIL